MRAFVVVLVVSSIIVAVSSALLDNQQRAGDFAAAAVSRSVNWPSANPEEQAANPSDYRDFGEHDDENDEEYAHAGYRRHSEPDRRSDYRYKSKSTSSSVCVWANEFKVPQVPDRFYAHNSTECCPSTPLNGPEGPFATGGASKEPYYYPDSSKGVSWADPAAPPPEPLAECVWGPVVDATQQGEAVRDTKTGVVRIGTTNGTCRLYSPITKCSPYLPLFSHNKHAAAASVTVEILNAGVYVSYAWVFGPSSALHGNLAFGSAMAAGEGNNDGYTATPAPEPTCGRALAVVGSGAITDNDGAVLGKAYITDELAWCMLDSDAFIQPFRSPQKASPDAPQQAHLMASFVDLTNRCIPQTVYSDEGGGGVEPPPPAPAPRAPSSPPAAPAPAAPLPTKAPVPEKEEADPRCNNPAVGYAAPGTLQIKVERL